MLTRGLVGDHICERCLYGEHKYSACKLRFTEFSPENAKCLLLLTGKEKRLDK